MTIPTVSWNESSPSGDDPIGQGDDRIRELKQQVREVIANDHQFNTSGQSADNGKHKKISLLEQADIGTGAVGKPILGAQTINGKAELVFTDEDDNDIQITKEGALVILGSEGFRSGDMLFSSNVNTPTGWLDVSTSYKDKFIRIGDGTPLSSGGSDTHTHAAGSYSAAAHTHTLDQNGTGGANTSLGVGINGGNLVFDTGVSYNLPQAKNTTTSGGGGAITGSSASANNIPAYIEMRLYQKI